MEAMPTPDLAVPYAAPKPAWSERRGGSKVRFIFLDEIWEGRGCGEVRT
jgi:hypothetical protein